jgi:septal ring factor EnvC (AmiA/AmiB activator)
LACAFAFACGLLLFAVVAQAQSPERNPHLDKRQGELRSVEDDLRLSDEQRRKIEAEVELIRSDRARLSAALLATASRVQGLEARASDVEKRLEASLAGEAAIRRSLDTRRNTIVEILAALQRIGRKPPPAILISATDILKAVRTAMILGALVPELRAETEILAADLSELVELRKRIASERDQRRTELSDLSGERERLVAIMDARRASLGAAEKALESEQERARALARQALDLKDLIARMEDETDGGKRAAALAGAADDERRRLASLKPDSRKPDPGSGAGLGGSGRLSPAVAFAQARGLLPLPVSGEIRKKFGAADDFGGNEKGLSIASRPGALVASPSDGWIAFSGPYRTYGQLLIINAGDGYYVVLAGMERINVAVGQFVLAGEPVASMGDASGKTAATIAIGAAQPILYVEFRKDGAAIDPGPWWAKQEKVRG